MNRYFLPLTFLFGTCVLLFLYLQGDQESTPKKEGAVQYTQIQQYQQEAKRKMELKKGQAVYQKMGGAPEIKNRNYEKDDSFQHTRQARPQYNEDLEEESYGGPETLDQKMNSFLAQQQEFSNMEEAQKQAFVQTFKQEARAMGYEVEVNSNLEIVNVRKIQKK